MTKTFRTVWLSAGVRDFGSPDVPAGSIPRVDPRETLRSLLEQFGRGATAAQNLVVVHCEIGSAPAIARALDRTQHPLVVGTLAGDDTCLVITAGSKDAHELAAELNAAIG